MNLNSNLISILRGIVKNLIESVVFFFFIFDEYESLNILFIRFV